MLQLNGNKVLVTTHSNSDFDARMRTELLPVTVSCCRTTPLPSQ